MTASRMATRFNTRARPRITAEHSETVTLTDGETSVESTLSVRWRRIQPKGESADGLGLAQYIGEATAVVLASDLATLPGPRSCLTRNGEDWDIRLVEPVDEWSYRMHLSRPEAEDRLPGSLRG